MTGSVEIGFGTKHAVTQDFSLGCGCACFQARIQLEYPRRIFPEFCPDEIGNVIGLHILQSVTNQRCAHHRPEHRPFITIAANHDRHLRLKATLKTFERTVGQDITINDRVVAAKVTFHILNGFYQVLCGHGAQTIQLGRIITDQSRRKILTSTLCTAVKKHRSRHVLHLRRVCWTLQHGAVKQASRQRRRQHMCHRLTAGRFTKNGDVSRISTKMADIFLHPLECCNLVESAVIAGYILV